MMTYKPPQLTGEDYGERGRLETMSRDLNRMNDLDTSSSVDKALALLTSFGSDAQSLGVSDLARRAGLPKSTAFRLLAILVAWGLVQRIGTRYSIGATVGKLAELAGSPAADAIRDLALPYLQDLYETTHETVHLAVPQGSDILYIEKIFGHNRVATPTQVGGRINAGCTALGKAILAFSAERTVGQTVSRMRPRTPNTIASVPVLARELAAVRAAGVAFDREESTVGVTCVGAPIFDARGEVVAAVSVTGPVSRFVPAEHADAVRRAASGIAKAAAYARGDDPLEIASAVERWDVRRRSRRIA